jgi:hypothetical protein
MKTVCKKPYVYSYSSALLRSPATTTTATQYRLQSTSNQIRHVLPDAPPAHRKPSPSSAPLAIMPTPALLRSLLFTSVMSSPLLGPSLALMKWLVESKSALLSPARNPLVNYLLRISIYNHFCAGTNETEVRRTVGDMKQLGFTGVILGYGREVVVNESSATAEGDESRQAAYEGAVEEWKQGNLRTLKMIGSGDYLGIK